MDTLGAMVVPMDAITENTVMNDKILTSHSGMISSIVKTACLFQRGGEIDLAVARRIVAYGFRQVSRAQVEVNTAG